MICKHCGKEIDDIGIETAQYVIAKWYLAQGKTATAFEWFKNAANNGSLEAHIALGDLYLKEQDFDTAIKWYQSSLPLCKSHNSIAEKIESARTERNRFEFNKSYNAGLKCEKNKNYDIAITNYENSLKFAQALNNSELENSIKTKIKSARTERNRFELKKYYEKGLDSKDRKIYDTAIFYYEKALKLAVENNDTEFEKKINERISECEHNILYEEFEKGENLLKRKFFEHAIKCFQEAIDVAKKHNNAELERQAKEKIELAKKGIEKEKNKNFHEPTSDNLYEKAKESGWEL